jgi:hypothetical protein
MNGWKVDYSVNIGSDPAGESMVRKNYGDVNW